MALQTRWPKGPIHMGLMAQDVGGRPDTVETHGGIKFVDYGKALARPSYAFGGNSSQSYDELQRRRACLPRAVAARHVQPAETRYRGDQFGGQFDHRRASGPQKFRAQMLRTVKANQTALALSGVSVAIRRWQAHSSGLCAAQTKNLRKSGATQWLRSAGTPPPDEGRNFSLYRQQGHGTRH